MEKYIQIKGARVNNLKNVDLNIPINQITCMAGPSGSGKSSLAFHTLYSESKRRFLNSFPTYLKFFSDRPAPVDVDEISPVLPVFGLPQINPIVGTRAIVADTMQLTESLQNLFYYFGKAKCPKHLVFLEKYNVATIISNYIKNLDDEDIIYLFATKDSFLEFLQGSPFPSRTIKNLKSNQINDFNKDDELWELLRFKKKGINRIQQKLSELQNLALETYLVIPKKSNYHFINLKLQGLDTCPICGDESIDKIQLTHFSPYNALGACSSCNGFGATLEYDSEKILDAEKSVIEGGAKLLEYSRFDGLKDLLINELKRAKISINKPVKDLPKEFYNILYKGSGRYCGYDELFSYLDSKRYKANVRIFIRGIQKEVQCESCLGSRLNQLCHHYFIFDDDLSYLSLWDLTIDELSNSLKSGVLIIKDPKQQNLLNKVISILDVANGLGLGHLLISRKSKTLSAGEYQRLLLLKYLSYEGTDSLFVFDEPSLGLCNSEQKILLKGFRKLKEQGNTVLLIDHSTFFHKNSDHLVVMGPGAGKFGGEVLFTGKYLNYETKLELPKISPIKNLNDCKFIEVKSPEVYGIEYGDFEIPIGALTCVFGNSGTGKTACLINVLANHLYKDIYGEFLNITKGSAKKITSKSNFNDVIVVDSNLNRYTSRSSVGSLTELSTIVRKHFLKTKAAKALGLKDGHLSSNSELGQCPSCEGSGVKVIEMQFLEDVILTCEDCNGKKIKPIYAELSDGKMTLYEAYNMPLSQVLERVELTPKFRRIWDYLKLLKLEYLSLDRKINSLSGGERQRIYLLSKLLKRVDNSILFFENLSFGLSDQEVYSLAKFLQDLCSEGNTAVIIDQHHLFKTAATYTLDFSKGD